MIIYCEVCGCNIKKSNWETHAKTTKQGVVCGDFVVLEEGEKNNVGNVRA